MKRCPTCNRTFDEAWLAFCTEDGTTLVETESPPPSNEPPPTVFIPPAPSTNQPAPKPFDLPGSYNPPQPVTPAWQPPPPPPASYTKNAKQGFAVTSLILGILSFPGTCLCYVGGIPMSIAAVVFGSISLVQIKNDPVNNTGKPLALTGVILGAAYLLLCIVIALIYGVAIFAGSLGNT